MFDPMAFSADTVWVVRRRNVPVRVSVPVQAAEVDPVAEI
jgi:hypothetical protein